MSIHACTVYYRRKDGTEASAEIEPNSSWTVPEDCVAVTGWDWPPSGGGASGHVGAVAGGGVQAEAEVEVAADRTYVVGPREPCEDHDGGFRACCGTRQLGPHAGNCPKPPSFQAGMLDHERMYWHETEVRDA